MKTTYRWIAALLLSMTLAACAGHTARQETVRCPACGYEVQPPKGG